jgi:hypothetical protein
MMDFSYDSGFSTSVLLNLPVQLQFTGTEKLFLPLKGSAGQTLYCRIRSSTASAWLNFGTIAGRKNSFDSPGFTNGLTYNVEVANTRPGTPAVPVHATAPAWTEIIAAGVIPAFKAFCFSIGENGAVAPTAEYHRVEVGIDVGGTVTKIGEHFLLAASSGLYMPRGLSNLFEVDIPAGSKIVARAWSPTGDNTKSVRVAFTGFVE